MASKGRFNHPVSLNEAQEDYVNKAREVEEISYAELLVLGAESWLQKKRINKKS